MTASFSTPVYTSPGAHPNSCISPRNKAFTTHHYLEFRLKELKAILILFNSANTNCSSAKFNSFTFTIYLFYLHRLPILPSQYTYFTFANYLFYLRNLPLLPSQFTYLTFAIYLLYLRSLCILPSQFTYFTFTIYIFYLHNPPNSPSQSTYFTFTI